MIQSKKDLLYFIREDYNMNSHIKRTWILNILFPNLILRFLKELRYCEYLINVKNVPFRHVRLLFHKYNYKRLSIKLGYSIPYNCFGEGLHLPHYGGIIVNSNARIGRYCSIRPYTVIGNKKNGKNDEVPYMVIMFK